VSIRQGTGRIGVVLVFAACAGGSDGPPLDVARGEIARLCGTKGLPLPELPGGGEGCKGPVKHERGRWYAAAHLRLRERDGALQSITVNLGGAGADTEELRRRALRVVAPLLDDTSERVVADALSRVYRVSNVASEFGALSPNAFEAGRIRVDDAYTGLDIEAPWRRTVRLSLLFRERTQPPEEMPHVPDAEFVSTLGVVTDDVRKAWQALCRDDVRMAQVLGAEVTDPVPSDDGDPIVPKERWSSGDVWARCMLRDAASEFRGHAIVDIAWAPASRRVVAVRVVAERDYGEAWSRLVEAFLTPVATPEQRRCLLEAPSECSGLVVIWPARTPERAFWLRTVGAL